MTDTPGRRTTKISDPTAERSSDPIPDGEDILNRDERGRDETPRRYEHPEDEPALPSNDSTLKTQI
jgi:hypothetical protein